jgi:phosphatidylserine synthase
MSVPSVLPQVCTIYQYALMDLPLLVNCWQLFLLFAVALRLARFNVNASVVHGYFVGMQFLPEVALLQLIFFLDITFQYCGSNWHRYTGCHNVQRNKIS